MHIVVLLLGGGYVVVSCLILFTVMSVTEITLAAVTLVVLLMTIRGWSVYKDTR